MPYIYGVKQNAMSAKVVLAALRVSVSVAYYIACLAALLFLVVSMINLAGNRNGGRKLTSQTYAYEVKRFDAESEGVPYTYSADSLVRYQGVNDHYALEVEPQSSMGYYALLMKLIFVGLGIGILWNFKKIFDKTHLERPFSHAVVKRLKILAALFVLTDVLKLVDYFVFNSFLRRSLASPHFELLTTVGDGMITGLIVWAIAVIYQRGVSLQEETALTV